MEVDNEADDAPRPVRMNAATQNEQLCLEILPFNALPAHESVFVNDPKLSDLRVFLNKNGFSAEFSAGTLYVNEVLRVVKNSAGQFEIECSASAEAYAIQDALYSQFGII